MATYDFNYKDNEGDEYSSDGHKTLQEARDEWMGIKEAFSDDCHITETWKYNDEGEFVGRPNIR